MFIKRLVWEQDNGNDEIVEHIIVDPSWDDIHASFLRLDGQAYPSFFLKREDQLVSFPSMSVFGGPDEYSISLERIPSNGRGSLERFNLINQSRFYSFGPHGWRGIGKSYHNYEVDDVYLVSDIKLILAIIEHFAHTGDWYFQAPFIVEVDDEEGEWRQYI